MFWLPCPWVSKVIEVGNIGSIVSSSPFAFATISLKVLVSYFFNVYWPHHYFNLLFILCVIFDFSASDDTQKTHKSRHRMHRSLGSSHKTMSRSFSGDSQSKGSVTMTHGSMVYQLYSCFCSFLFCNLFPHPTDNNLFLIDRYFKYLHYF